MSVDRFAIVRLLAAPRCACFTFLRAAARCLSLVKPLIYPDDTFPNRPGAARLRPSGFRVRGDRCQTGATNDGERQRDAPPEDRPGGAQRWGRLGQPGRFSAAGGTSDDDSPLGDTDQHSDA